MNVARLSEEPVSYWPLVETGRGYFADWGGNVYLSTSNNYTWPASELWYAVAAVMKTETGELQTWMTALS